MKITEITESKISREKKKKLLRAKKQELTQPLKHFKEVSLKEFPETNIQVHANGPLKFLDIDSVEKWKSEFQAHNNEEYCDNDRFAFLDDPKSVERYKQLLDKGCCGFDDFYIMVGNRRAVIGWNFGH